MKTTVQWSFTIGAILILTGTLLSGCGETEDCAQEELNCSIYDHMKDWYYWYDKLPDVDCASYSSAEELLADLRYERKDPWSYIKPEESYDDWYEKGRYKGLGFKWAYDERGNARIVHVHESSMANAAGLKRGDEIKAVNGIPVAEIERMDLWDTVFGPEEIGIEVTMRISDPHGKQHEITMKTDWVYVRAVYDHRLFEVKGKNVGYIVFYRFIEPAYDQLEAVFDYFKRQNVEDLILDLRYNGGGRLRVARFLASLIKRYNGEEVFEILHFNDKHRDEDTVYHFEKEKNSLNLDRVIILTSSDTCSASECVINGLKPYIRVITIGSTTCGKPVGMRTKEICDMRLAPISFEGVNAEGRGNYYNGLFPTCRATDDLCRDLGDPEEAMLEEALYYVRTGRCRLFSADMAGADKDEPLFERKPTRLRGFRREIGSF